MANLTIIDISKWQAVIDWNKVKPSIDAAIIRVGYGSDFQNQDDEYALRNIKECERLGIPWGPYIYSYAHSTDMVKSEYAHCKRMCKGHKPTLPWYIDLEENQYGTFARTAAIEWCKAAKADGQRFGVYTGAWYFRNFISGAAIPDCSWWIAAYGTNDGTMQMRVKPNIGITYDGWQYTSRKTFNGINGGVDTSVFYKDVRSSTPVTPAKPKPEPTTPTKTVDQLAKEVIEGKWGNGEERIRKLMNAGYDANAVQKRVNEMLEKPNAITYTVKPGDTLWAIGSKYGVPYVKIAFDNGISNPDIIHVGQKLVINR